MASFDPLKTSPADAQKLIAEIAEMLGVEDPENADHDTIDAALDQLFAIVTGGNGGGGSDGGNDSSANAMAPPKQVNQNAVKRGRQIMPLTMDGVKRLYRR